MHHLWWLVEYYYIWCTYISVSSGCQNKKIWIKLFSTHYQIIHNLFWSLVQFPSHNKLPFQCLMCKYSLKYILFIFFFLFFVICPCSKSPHVNVMWSSGTRTSCSAVRSFMKPWWTVTGKHETISSTTPPHFLHNCWPRSQMLVIQMMKLHLCLSKSCQEFTFLAAHSDDLWSALTVVILPIYITFVVML